MKELDADALGTSIAPLFLDGLNDDLLSDFPRIASRYQLCDGKLEQMEEFLYYQMGVSKESQESAKDMANEMREIIEIHLPPPPPVQLIDYDTKESSPDALRKFQEVMKKHRQGIDRKANDLFRNLAGPCKHGTDIPVETKDDPQNLEFITPEQQRRGYNGEEEIKRRFLLPGGWQGFSLKMDMRDIKCGYDFLCTLDGRDVKVEVKAFTRNGRIIVSSLELQAAANDPINYYLLGILDENGINNESKTYVIRSPLGRLILTPIFAEL